MEIEAPDVDDVSDRRLDCRNCGCRCSHRRSRRGRASMRGFVALAQVPDGAGWHER